MKKLYFSTLFLIICVSSFTTNAQSNPAYMVGPFSDIMWSVDTSTYVNSPAVGMNLTVPGFIVTGCNGLATRPCTGEIFIVYKEASTIGRMLGIVDTTNGVITPIGNMGDNVAGIAFGSKDHLYAVTGDGANTPSTLFKVNISTGALTFFTAYGNGDDGENISFCKDNGKVYHWSGISAFVMESTDTLTGVTTNVPLSGYTYSEVFGSAYIGNGEFVLIDINLEVIMIDTSGFAQTPTLFYSDNVKGIAFPYINDTISPVLSTLDATSFCPGDSAVFDVTAGSGYQWYLDGVAIPGATNQNYSVMQAGDLHAEVQNIGGCSIFSSDTVSITLLNAPVVSITPGDTSYCIGDSVLLTGSSGGTSQWFMDGNAIAGATNNTYYVTSPGYYNMLKTNTNGCSDSSVVGVMVVEDSCGLGIYDYGFDNRLKLFPSPTNDALTIEFESASNEPIHIVIYSQDGRIEATFEIKAAANITSFTFNVGKLASGIYNLGLEQSGSKVLKRFVKK